MERNARSSTMARLKSVATLKSVARLKSVGSGRTMVATAFAVWALLLQSLLPVAGAFASDSGNRFLIELCTTAGVQALVIEDDGSTSERPVQTKTGAGCDLCVGCDCLRGVAACGAMASAPTTPWVFVAWTWSQQSESAAQAVSGFRSRAPPVS